MRANRCGALAVVLALCAQAQTNAGPQRFELERLSLNPSGGASLVTSSGDALGANQFRVSLLGHYQHDPLVVYRDTGERVGAIVGHRFTAELMGAWAPFEFLEVGLHLPVVLSQGGDDLSSLGVSSTTGAGLATPSLYGRWAALRQARGAPVDLSVQLGFGLPIGSSAGFANDGQVTVTPRVGVGRTFGWLRVGGEVGMELRRPRQLGAEVLGHTLGVAVSLTTTGPGLRGELTGRTQFSVAPAGSAAGDVLLGARYPLGAFEVFALGGPGIGNAMGNPVFRVLAGVAWQPASAPKAKGPMAPVCAEGDAAVAKACPALDLDHDGVKNGDDACLDVAGAVAERGCPVPDSDGDGVKDDADACPRVAGAEAGCPPKDSDGDGVLDASDACPSVAGAEGGCPPKDSDGDGVADAADACPSDPGAGSSDGCPKKAVVVARGKLVISEKIQFETNKAVLLAVSQPLLDRVAEVLKAHPEVGVVTIEGHTDSMGPRAFNLDLSKRRADAVSAALVSRGLPASRFKTDGMGPDEPIADEKTSAGREQNRRVEFHFEAVTP